MKDKPMEESDIVAFLGRKIEQSLNDDDGDLSQVRKDNLNYYLGKAYGNERDGYSAVVTRESMEAVEWAHPLIMRVFSSGDRVVAFNPVGPEDEPVADQETDAVRHELFEKNNGFMTLYSWIKDALMYPNAYAKVWPDESVHTAPEEYKGLTEIELGQLLNTEDEIELESHDIYPGGQELLYDVKLRRTVRDVRIMFEPCEPDQILVDNDLTALALENADFVCHRVQRTFTWLVENGYDKDKLDEIGTTSHHEWADERTNRLFYEDENPDESADDDESMRNYWVHECYVSLDEDGDGLAERRKIVMIGDVIFEDEEDDYMPIVALSSIPMSHKHTGISLVDTVKELQLVMSTLVRNLLDNIYRINIRRKYVGRNAQTDDGTTLEQLQDTASEIIECEDVNGIKEETVQPIAPEILAVIQEIGQQVQTRTGINPGMSMDPNVLKESTMGAFTAALDQASQRVELITRVFAETGIKDAMSKAHRLMREHMNKQQMLRLRGEWVPTDPSAWRERRNLTVEVGTGFYSKEKRTLMLTSLLKEQKELMAMGLGVVQPHNLYNTATRLADVIGEREPDVFFTDPRKLPPQQPPQDPAMLQLQMVAQVESDKRAVEREKNQTDAMLRSKEIELKHIRETQSAQGNQVINIKKLQLEAEVQALTQRKAELEQMSDQADRDLKARLSAEEIASREKIEAAKLIHDGEKDEQGRILVRETRDAQKPPDTGPDIAAILREQEQRREKRVNIVANYFASDRTDEALKETAIALQNA